MPTPTISRDEIKRRVNHLLHRFSKISEDQIDEKDPLLRFFPNNYYARLLFGGHITGIFPKVDQTSFANNLFSSALDTVAEVIDHIKKYYPDNFSYDFDQVASFNDINNEFHKMQDEISKLL